MIFWHVLVMSLRRNLCTWKRRHEETRDVSGPGQQFDNASSPMALKLSARATSK